jgi:hypothetical protein
MKIPFVAAAALAAHNLKPELGSEMLSKASNALQKYIDSGSWREAKLLLRFLGGLQSAFEGDGIFPLLEELFARAVDLQTTSSEDVSHAPFCTRGFALTQLNAAARTGACQDHSVHNPIRDVLSCHRFRVPGERSPRENGYHCIYSARSG